MLTVGSGGTIKEVDYNSTLGVEMFTWFAFRPVYKAFDAIMDRLEKAKLTTFVEEFKEYRKKVESVQLLVKESEEGKAQRELRKLIDDLSKISESQTQQEEYLRLASMYLLKVRLRELQVKNHLVLYEKRV